jgi:hypothetical protein
MRASADAWPQGEKSLQCARAGVCAVADLGQESSKSFGIVSECPMGALWYQNGDPGEADEQGADRGQQTKAAQRGRRCAAR